jgi:hypothetical protein
MARKVADDTIVNLRLRLPEALRRQLVAEAEAAKRSLNSEILWRLGQTFSERWQKFIAGIAEEEDQRQEFLKRLQANPDFQETLWKIIQANPPKRKGEG